jgi:hypothetical protein
MEMRYGMKVIEVKDIQEALHYFQVTNLGDIITTAASPEKHRPSTQPLKGDDL